MRHFFLTLDKIVFLFLFFLFNFFPCRNSNNLSIKYQSYPKSRKIDGFEQKICISHDPSYQTKKVVKACELFEKCHGTPKDASGRSKKLKDSVQRLRSINLLLCYEEQRKN